MVEDDESDFEAPVDPREGVLRDGVVEVESPTIEEGPEATTDPIELFKLKIAQVFKISQEELEKLTVRDDIEISVMETPTRRERMGYKWLPNSEDRKARVPKWAREVQCPRCGNIMIPLKSKSLSKPKDKEELDHPKFGENITYQCHGIDEAYRPCLLVTQLTTSVGYLMRPSDFTKSDWNWKGVAEETIPVIPGTKVKELRPSTALVKPVEKPWNPWEKQGAMSYVLWEAFWDIIMRDGECGVDELRQEVIKKRPQDKTNAKFAAKLSNEIVTLPSWGMRRSGYSIKLFGNVLRVVGQAKGHLDWAPYSDAEYRKIHGMVGYGYEI